MLDGDRSCRTRPECLEPYSTSRGYNNTADCRVFLRAGLRLAPTRPGRYLPGRVHGDDDGCTFSQPHLCRCMHAYEERHTDAHGYCSRNQKRPLRTIKTLQNPLAHRSVTCQPSPGNPGQNRQHMVLLLYRTRVSKEPCISERHWRFNIHVPHVGMPFCDRRTESPLTRACGSHV